MTTYARLLASASVVTCLTVACDRPDAPTASTVWSADAAATSAQTSTVVDALGDVKNSAPAWLDLTSASIARQGGRLIFTWDVAAPVPADPASDPAIPAHSDHVCLGDGLETDPATAPLGYPFGKNEANFAEFYVALCWSPTGSFGLGAGFVGLLIDRRPLLAGGEAMLSAVEVRIAGNHVAVTVDAGRLGDPATFAWVAFTEIANQADPNDAAKFPDFAPDATLATWPY